MRLEFASQGTDMKAHGVVRRSGRTVPDGGDQVVERHRPAGVSGQQLEDGEFGRRQADVPPRLHDLPSLDVDEEIGKLELRRRERIRPTQLRADASQQLRHPEALAYI